MIIEHTYDSKDLTTGKCCSCGEQSNEILKENGKCLDCIESEFFYELTMSGKE